MAQYIGPWEIESKEELAETVKVTFKEFVGVSGDTFQPPMREYSYKVFLAIVTEEISDFTTVREKQYAGLCDDIIRLFVEYDLQIGSRTGEQTDIIYVYKTITEGFGKAFEQVVQKVNDLRNSLDDKYWGEEENEKTLRKLLTKWAEMRDAEVNQLKITKKKEEDSQE